MCCDGILQGSSIIPHDKELPISRLSYPLPVCSPILANGILTSPRVVRRAVASVSSTATCMPVEALRERCRCAAIVCHGVESIACWLALPRGVACTLVLVRRDPGALEHRSARALDVMQTPEHVLVSNSSHASVSDCVGGSMRARIRGLVSMNLPIAFVIIGISRVTARIL